MKNGKCVLEAPLYSGLQVSTSWVQLRGSMVSLCLPFKATRIVNDLPLLVKVYVCCILFTNMIHTNIETEHSERKPSRSDDSK